MQHVGIPLEYSVAYAESCAASVPSSCYMVQLFAPAMLLRLTGALPKQVGICMLRPKGACRMSDFGCENAQAIASAPNVFTTMGEMATKRCNWQPSRGYPHGLLGPSCHLFARK